MNGGVVSVVIKQYVILSMSVSTMKHIHYVQLLGKVNKYVKPGIWKIWSDAHVELEECFIFRIMLC